MQPKFKFAFIYMFILSSIFLIACGNKIDRTLDKVEDIVSKYEIKTKDKTMTKQDMKDLEKQLAENSSTILGTPQSDWTQSQKDRFEKLSARGARLAEDNMNLISPY